MAPDTLEAYLHQHIPISRAMGVRVLHADDERIELSAPLAPNVNHRETVFGGSAAAVATLAAWSLIHVRLKHLAIDARVVIQHSEIDYLRPIAGDFTGVAILDSAERWQRFLETLTRKGRARITLASSLHEQNQIAGAFVGDFVAVRVSP